MKKGVLFGVVCAAVLFISTFAACNSNEEPVMDFDTDEISAKIITDKDEILAVYDSAFDFLSGSRSIPQSVSHAGNLSTKYSDEILQKSSWDLSKVTKVNNVYQDQYCYMAGNLKSENLMLCTISDKERTATTTFTVSKDGNLYTMYNSYGEPMITVSYDANNNVLIVEQLFSFAKDRVFWCKIGMAALGGAISVVAIPATMGAGAIFSVCWSVATDIACV